MIINRMHFVYSVNDRNNFSYQTIYLRILNGIFICMYVCLYFRNILNANKTQRTHNLHKIHAYYMYTKIFPGRKRLKLKPGPMKILKLAKNHLQNRFKGGGGGH